MFVFFLASLICTLAACDSAPRDSLVGPWKIEPDDQLSKETITLWFRRDNGTEYSNTMSYTLNSNGLLEIEKGRDHIVFFSGGIDHHLTDKREKFILSHKDQIKIRRMIGRLRPEKLSNEVPFSLPQGCTYTFDSRAWSGAIFERGKLGGAFIFQPDCKGKGADKVKMLLGSVMATLPPVLGSADFLRNH